MAGKRNVIVPRVSDRGDREDEQFYSPDIQIDKATAWSDREGDTVVAVFPEIDVSGTLPLRRRKGLLPAIEMVEAGDADQIVVTYFDRVARKLKVQHEILERVEAAGGDVYALDHGRLTNGTAAQRISINMLGAVFQFYSEIIGEKVKPAQDRAIARGVAPFPRLPPGIIRGEDDRCTAASDPEAEPMRTVIEAFERRARGDSWPEVRTFLADNGIYKSLHGTMTMIQSKLYIGEIHFGPREPNLNAHDPIIDPNLWHAAQLPRMRRGGPRPKSQALLARLGVLKCGNCGGGMTVNNAGGFYRCQGSRLKGCDAKASVRAHRVEAIAIEEVSAYVTNETIHGEASREARIRAADAKVKRADDALQGALRVLRDFQNEEGTVDTLNRLRAERKSAQDDRDKLGPGGRKLFAHPDDIRKLPPADQVTAWRRLLTDTGCVITVAPAVNGSRLWDDSRITVTFQF
jgi:DNA invertase Pin-like site-specific DNA recombinase